MSLAKGKILVDPGKASDYRVTFAYVMGILAGIAVNKKLMALPWAMPLVFWLPGLWNTEGSQFYSYIDHWPVRAGAIQDT